MLGPVTMEMVDLALREDLAGYGDVTSSWTVPQGAQARAHVVAREEAVVSGLDVAEAVLWRVDASCGWRALATAGEEVAQGAVLAELWGDARHLLAAERTLLNFLRHLCGVATQARRFARAVVGTGALVVDTRKTLPGMRVPEKRALRARGCGNHRLGLLDTVPVNDNH